MSITEQQKLERSIIAQNEKNKVYFKTPVKVIEKQIPKTKLSKIVKKCKYHGGLTINEIYTLNSKITKCLHCKNNIPSTTNIEKMIFKELNCNKCKITKSFDNFYKNAIPSDAICKECDRQRKKEYRKRPEVREREYTYEMKKHYEKRYGITFDQYNELLIKQNNVCAICKTKNKTIDKRTKRPKRLNVDHCHSTKKVRGLLCTKCNTGIGFFNDNILLLESCLRYIHESLK